MTIEHPKDNNGQSQLSWGEWREEQTGQPIKGERWKETHKEYEDYWDRKS